MEFKSEPKEPSIFLNSLNSKGEWFTFSLLGFSTLFLLICFLGLSHSLFYSDEEDETWKQLRTELDDNRRLSRQIQKFLKFNQSTPSGISPLVQEILESEENLLKSLKINPPPSGLLPFITTPGMDWATRIRNEKAIFKKLLERLETLIQSGKGGDPIPRETRALTRNLFESNRNKLGQERNSKHFRKKIQATFLGFISLGLLISLISLFNLFKIQKERAQSLANLKEERRNLKELFDSIPLAVFIVGEGGQIEFQNLTSQTLFNSPLEVNLEKLDNISLIPFSPEENLPPQKVGEMIQEEGHLTSKTGEVFHVIRQIKPFPFQGKILRIHSFLDLNPQKEAEKAIEKAEKYLKGLGEAISRQFEGWSLTRAEKQVGLLILKGFSFKDIARFRGTNEKTVRQQALTLYRKSGSVGRAEFSAFFLEDLLVPFEETELEGRAETSEPLTLKSLPKG